MTRINCGQGHLSRLSCHRVLGHGDTRWSRSESVSRSCRFYSCSCRIGSSRGCLMRDTVLAEGQPWKRPFVDVRRGFGLNCLCDTQSGTPDAGCQLTPRVNLSRWDAKFYFTPYIPCGAWWSWTLLSDASVFDASLHGKNFGTLAVQWSHAFIC